MSVYSIVYSPPKVWSPSATIYLTSTLFTFPPCLFPLVTTILLSVSMSLGGGLFYLFMYCFCFISHLWMKSYSSCPSPSDLFHSEQYCQDPSMLQMAVRHVPWLSSVPLWVCTCIYHIFFTQLSTEGYLSWNTGSQLFGGPDTFGNLIHPWTMFPLEKMTSPTPNYAYFSQGLRDPSSPSTNIWFSSPALHFTIKIFHICEASFYKPQTIIVYFSRIWI